jgi:hypothetical protein
MPRSAIFRSRDPYEHQRSLRAEAVDLVVTAPGDFRGEVTRIDVDRLWLQRGRESLPRVVHSAVSKRVRAPRIRRIGSTWDRLCLRRSPRLNKYDSRSH